MAEVLSPMLPHPDPAKMLQSRPSSAETFQTGGMSGQHQHSQPPRIIQMPRNHFNGHNGGAGYRGTATAPVSPYAFKATPHLRNDSRTSSAPSTPSLHPVGSENLSPGNRQRYPATASVSTTSSSASSNPPSWSQHLSSKDDSVISSSTAFDSFTSQATSALEAVKSPSASASLVAEAPVRASPDRYRRTNRKSETNVPTLKSQQNLENTDRIADQGPAVAKMGQFFHHPQSTALPLPQNTQIVTDKSSGQESAPHLTAGAHLDDSHNARSPGADSFKRYRRRSSNNMDGKPKDIAKSSPGSSVTDLSNSDISQRPSSAKQDSRPASSSSATHKGSTMTSKSIDSDNTKLPVTAVTSRTHSPSPLSRPLSSSNSQSLSPGKKTATTTPPYQNSPAAAAMAALNERDPQKGMKSRLRRAFSFGSSAELRRAAGESEQAQDRARQKKEAFSTDLDEEQDAIAQRQEAAGLGHNIYTGQGNVFTGSQDNLSISSTASSASMMLRKMGQGMKKGGRSIKGLFRPKSVVGVPAADGPLVPSIGQISRVTVEAEREKVNVNVDPHDQAGGGTGFPRLERNSVDVAKASATQVAGEAKDANTSRRTVVGGEQDRAEVLAAVRRGILKRSSTAPVSSVALAESLLRESNATSEQQVSPVPSVTGSEHRRSGHRRMDSHTLEGDDYFASMPRIPANGSSRSLPDTPRGISRGISFSPRIQFHDVWSSSDYDRRGDIATCNRLTPMLAQQIKEELNTFKMEMEVHELSKPHTHFF